LIISPIWQAKLIISLNWQAKPNDNGSFINEAIYVLFRTKVKPLTVERLSIERRRAL
jgi:hypothetical protein